MERNYESESNIIDDKPSSSDANNDPFDFKDCKSSLPTDEKAKFPENDSGDEYSDALDEDLELDEESIKKTHENLSDEELQNLKDEAAKLKNSGNDHFKQAEHKEAELHYTKALNICPLQYTKDRSVLYANRAAARINLELKDEAVLDCNKAIELNPDYVKAIVRRAQLHRNLDNLERSLEDYQRVLELDPNNAEARKECTILPPEIAEKNEKLKTEMFGKLKELGNMCLKPFGLSTENFKVVQDPNSGGYSINFQNNQ